jgi:WD40 repeat protein
VSRERAVGGPRGARWVAAVYRGESDAKPVGAGFLVDDTRVLTAAHVMRRGEDLAPVAWVEFPRSGVGGRVRARVVVADDGSRQQRDVAVLVLDKPIPGLAAARLRRVDPEGLTGSRWWSYGFPRDDAVGDPAEGRIHGPLAGGLFLLEADERYPAKHGFSGAPVWSDRYQAVVGLITQAFPGTGVKAGDARAMSLLAVERCLPKQDLRALTRWRLGDGLRDAEHWDPRSRGVGVSAEEGFRFQGRHTALGEITAWMGTGASRSVLMVTGDPGTGKSAVLGRIVASADPDGARALDAAGDAGVRARVGSVWCAVHAGGKTGLEIAEEIARAASVPLPHSARDLSGQIRSMLKQDGHFGGYGLTLVIDAVDEAKSPEDAREVLQQIVVPLARDCGDLGLRVLIGSRRRDARGELAARLGHAATLIDLDAPNYFARDDLEAYALASLQLRGSERAGKPYTDPSIAAPVAARIARIAERNFLIAGLIARYHGLYDEQPVNPARISLTETTSEAFALYLTAVPGCADLNPAQLLTGLAYTHGVSTSLWRTILHALYETSPSIEQLRRFAGGAAANFLVKAVGDGEEREYRLFHQALNDVLLDERDNHTPDERAIARALIAQGQAIGWANAPAYLLRHLARHATAGQVLDELLADHSYLPYAEPRNLTPYLHRARGEAALLTAAVYRFGVHLHENATPGERRDVLALDAARAGAHALYRNLLAGMPGGRWVPHWATGSTFNPALRDTLIGHTDTVSSVACTVVDGSPVAVTGGVDGTVRLWDLRTGQQIGRPLTEYTSQVSSVACTVLDGAPVAVTVGLNDTVWVWDLRTGRQIGPPLTVYTSRVFSVACTVLDDDTPVAVTGSGDGTVQRWNVRTKEQIGQPLAGHVDAVHAVACTMLDGAPVAVTGSMDGTVRVWDVRTGQQIGHPMIGHADGVTSVARTVLDGNTPVAVTSGEDDTVRVWNLHTGKQIGRPLLRYVSNVISVACAVIEGAPLTLIGSGDDTARVWDLSTARQVDRTLTGHTGPVASAVCTMLDDVPVAVTGSMDCTVRVWDLGTAQQVDRPSTGHAGPVASMACTVLDGLPVVVTGSEDRTVRVWDLRTGQQIGRSLTGHTDWVEAVACTMLDGAPVAVTGSVDRTVRVWDVRAGQQIGHPMIGHTGIVTSVACAVFDDGTPVAVTGSWDRTVRVWNLLTGKQIGQPLTGHAGWVTSVACTVFDGAPLAFTGGEDGTARIWDVRTGQQIGQPLTGHTRWVREVACTILDGSPVAATAGWDNTVWVWDLRTRREIERFLVPQPKALAFAAQGGLVVGCHCDIAIFNAHH